MCRLSRYQSTLGLEQPWYIPLRTLRWHTQEIRHPHLESQVNLIRFLDQRASRSEAPSLLHTVTVVLMCYSIGNEIKGKHLLEFDTESRRETQSVRPWPLHASLIAKTDLLDMTQGHRLILTNQNGIISSKCTFERSTKLALS